MRRPHAEYLTGAAPNIYRTAATASRCGRTELRRYESHGLVPMGHHGRVRQGLPTVSTASAAR